MEIKYEVKCPYCYEWEPLTATQFNYAYHKCTNCFSLFRLDDTILESSI